MSHITIPVEDEFNNPEGKFEHYDAYEAAQRFDLPKQRHVDIRNFNAGDENVTITMVHLDRIIMSTLDSRDMSDLEAGVVLVQAEDWSDGTVAIQADRNNWDGITLTLAAGTNITSSVIRL